MIVSGEGGGSVGEIEGAMREEWEECTFFGCGPKVHAFD